jgi:hypothetical protein
MTKQRHNDSGFYMVIAILFGCAITMFLLAGVASGQELRRRVGPPTPSFREPTCAETLDALRFKMWQLSKAEATLHHNNSIFATDKKTRKAERGLEDYYLKRANDTLSTKDLTPSFNSCRVGNVKELRITVALWEFEYSRDAKESVNGTVIGTE